MVLAAHKSQPPVLKRSSKEDVDSDGDNNEMDFNVSPAPPKQDKPSKQRAKQAKTQPQISEAVIDSKVGIVERTNH